MDFEEIFEGYDYSSDATFHMIYISVLCMQFHPANTDLKKSEDVAAAIDGSYHVAVLALDRLRGGRPLCSPG